MTLEEAQQFYKDLEEKYTKKRIRRRRIKMALKLPKNAEKKATGFLYLKEEGLYKVVLAGNEDAVDEKKNRKEKVTITIP